jgi:hypothetical protein
MSKIRVHFKLSLHQVVVGNTHHGPASAGVPTGRNQERQFEMRPKIIAKSIVLILSRGCYSLQPLVAVGIRNSLVQCLPS